MIKYIFKKRVNAIVVILSILLYNNKLIIIIVYFTNHEKHVQMVYNI